MIITSVLLYLSFNQLKDLFESVQEYTDIEILNTE